jgi:hypothetical protein
MNASTLIVAGSETTATLLSGAIYLLLANPDKLAKLVKEVRSTFKSDEEITLTSVQSLTYMLACLNESLRCYPPVASGLPRVVPKGGNVVAGQFIPEDVSKPTFEIGQLQSSADALCLLFFSDRCRCLAVGYQLRPAFLDRAADVCT